MLFYRKNLISLFCSIVRKRNKCVLPPQTEISYILTISTAKNISLYHSNRTDVCKGSPDCKNDSSDDTNSLSDDANVKKACQHLLMNGTDMQALKEYEKYLSKSPKDAYIKAKLLTEVKYDTSLILPLIKLSPIQLKWVLMRSKEDPALCKNFSDRLSYLCHNLEVNRSDLINSLYKHSPLLTMDFVRLSSKMVILRSAGISAEDLAKDLWIFNYNEKLLGERIAKLQEAKMPIKPWLLRCHPRTFESALSKWTNTQSLLKGRSELEFLAEKLNCSEDYVKLMMKRNKLLTSINVPKLEQIINFLYEKGYTPEEIRIFPRVFCSSVKTLSKRFNGFYKLRGTMPTMSQLCISSRKYAQSLNNK